MTQPTARDDGPQEPLAAETAALLVAFARACKAAARTVSLYPGEHPVVSAALLSLTGVAQRATTSGPFSMAVTPDTLLVARRRIARPDAAVTELAALLHAQQVGQLIVHPQTDEHLWRRFLGLLGQPPDRARVQGGLARLWASEGESRIEVRRIDFDALLRERIRGDRATWDRIAAECLEGQQVELDDRTIDLIGGILDRPGQIGELLTAVNARSSAEGTSGADTVGGLLQAVARFVGESQPDALESVMTAIADAAARLPVTTLGPLVKTPRTGTRASLGRFVADLVQRVQDGTIADMVAGEVRSGRGTSPALGDALCGLAPDPARRLAILNMARRLDPSATASGEPAPISSWESSEQFLRAYSDKTFVSEAYDGELGRIAERAVELDKDQTDPPDRIAAWAQTVDEAAIRLLDAQMLVDLMSLQREVDRWRELAALAIARIDMLVVVGDFSSATFLVGAMHHQAHDHDEPAVQAAAAGLLDQLVSTAMMRHVAAHLDMTDRPTIAAAKGFCLALGTRIVGPLAEVLSREDRTRARDHLVEILLGLGTAGRQSVERLKLSPNAAVRRTAVLLLREFGGSEALLDLESLLKDAEPHVQRDATRAIASMHNDAAFDTLMRALMGGTDHARSVILGVLSSMPNEEALPVVAYLVKRAPCSGPMWQVYERAIQRLGAIGGPIAVDALVEALNKRVMWAPLKVAVLRRLAADALARIRTADAHEALRAAAATGMRGARSAARKHLSALESGSRSRGKQS